MTRLDFWSRCGGKSDFAENGKVRDLSGEPPGAFLIGSSLNQSDMAGLIIIYNNDYAWRCY